ncbi:hypothetical protein BG005_000945 [Podila minutissima]|nr:hypothetical protein BG005_000945 [Podila minutissima]
MSVESLQIFVCESLLQCLGPHPTRAAKEKYLVLKIVSQVLHWLENDIFAMSLLEHVFVTAWSDVLNMLFAQSGLRGIPGELGSRASREARSLTESLFGGKLVTSTSSRKVDMTIRVFVDKSWADETCVFECKPEVSDHVCQVQQGKSVRLNTAILLALEEKGLDIAQWHHTIAETRALSIDFYTLRRYGEVIGAGRSTQEKVWLPFGYNKLDAFLSSRSFEVLLGFRVRHRYTCVLPSHTTLNVSRRRRPLVTSNPTLNVYTCGMITVGIYTLDLLSNKHAGCCGACHPYIRSISHSIKNLCSPTNNVKYHGTTAAETNAPPPRKRDLPFVLFSPSKSPRRKSSMDYGRPIVHDDEDLAL